MRFTKVGNDNKAKMEPQKQKSEGQNVFIMVLKILEIPVFPCMYIFWYWGSISVDFHNKFQYQDSEEKLKYWTLQTNMECGQLLKRSDNINKTNLRLIIFHNSIFLIYTLPWSVGYIWDESIIFLIDYTLDQLMKEKSL